MEFIPIVSRACDICNARVTDDKHTACKSFVLTDWGVICFECWDNRITYHRDFELVESYVKSQKIEDDWIRRPIVIAYPHKLTQIEGGNVVKRRGED